jgi:hypothetical protein
MAYVLTQPSACGPLHQHGGDDGADLLAVESRLPTSAYAVDDVAQGRVLKACGVPTVVPIRQVAVHGVTGSKRAFSVLRPIATEYRHLAGKAEPAHGGARCMQRRPLKGRLPRP